MQLCVVLCNLLVIIILLQSSEKCNELQIPLQDQNVTQLPLQLPLKINT